MNDTPMTVLLIMKSAANSVFSFIRCCLNFVLFSTDSCENIKNALLSQPHWSDRLEDVCQAKLVRIDLYQLHCKELNITEVSLNFTFQLPICGIFLLSLIATKSFFIIKCCSQIWFCTDFPLIFIGMKMVNFLLLANFQVPLHHLLNE